MSDMWHQLDSLSVTSCHSCQCCLDLCVERDFHRLYEFLTRLRPEFEQHRAQLLARHPRVTLVEDLTELLSEKTRLREILDSCHFL